MSDAKISELPGSTGLTLALDYIPIVHNGITQKITPSQLLPTEMTSAVAIAGVSTVAQSLSAEALKAGASVLQSLTVNNVVEPTTVVASTATGTIAYYPLLQSVMYYTAAATGNWTINIAYSSTIALNSRLSVGQSLTLAFLVTQGTTAFYNTVVQIDGVTSGVTTRWQGGTAPTAGNASGIDVYTYTVIKTAAATFTVLASLVQF